MTPPDLDALAQTARLHTATNFGAVSVSPDDLLWLVTEVQRLRRVVASLAGDEAPALIATEPVDVRDVLRGGALTPPREED